MAQKVLQKRYFNHFGLDLKSSDLTRPPEYASDMLNAQYRKSGAPETRRGFQAHATTNGGFGLFRYDRVNPTTSALEPEVVSVSDTLSKFTESSITISYTGAGTTSLIEIFYDIATSVYRLQIIEGTTTILDQSMNIGFDEVSFLSLNTLTSNINALTDYTATLSGDGSGPAAFLKIVRQHELVSGSLTAIAGGWSSVNGVDGSGAAFAGSLTNKNSSSFENVTSVQINNALYLSNGYDNPVKYDGQNVYRAGMEPADDFTSLVAINVGSGSIAAGTYGWKYRFVQVDAVGNTTEGNLSDFSSHTDASTFDMTLTMESIPVTSGYMTNHAFIVGAQAGVTTINVDDGAGGDHTLSVGDTATFLDTSGTLQRREITARTSSTIDIAGAVVTVADNAIVSNGLTLEIYRSKDTGGTDPTAFFFVAEIPNDPTTSNVYIDTTADASLGGQLVEPLTDRSPPPKGNYISAFRNQMIIAGDPENPNTVYYSDVDGPEYFPDDSNSFVVQSESGSKINGIAPNNEVFAVFQDRGIHVLSGDIAENNIRVDQISNDIGCVAHATIVEVRGSLYFLDDTGPRKMIGGQVPSALGKAVDDDFGFSSRIDPAFEQRGIISTAQKFVTKRTIGFNDRSGEKYWLFVPAETTTGGDVHPNSNSIIYAYDYSRDAWLKWDTLNFAGGIVDNGDEIYMSERRYSSFNSSVDNILYRQHTLDDAWSFQDNNAEIVWNYKAQWEFLGDPSVLKRFLRARVFSLESENFSEKIVTVKTETDFLQDTKSNFSIDFTTSGYGSSAYGTTPYGDPEEGAIRRRLLPGRARSMRVVFESSMDQQNTIISGWELEIALPFAPEFKR